MGILRLKEGSYFYCIIVIGKTKQIFRGKKVHISMTFS